MNPRILKKLSKKSDFFLKNLNIRLDRIEYDGGDSIESAVIVDRKHLERIGRKPNKYGWFVALRGTVGYGQVSGHYEPEWTDTDAYSTLREAVLDHFTDWSNCDVNWNPPEPRVKLNNPSDVFKYARTIIE